MDNYTYEVFDDGYDIYLNGLPHISQRKPYDKMFVANGTYEENAEAQIAELSAPPAPPIEEQQLRADVDYMALMLDVDLPSQQEEEE